MRRLVLGRGSGPARDLPPGCGRVHRFATVPDEDALRRCGSGSPEAGQRRDAWEHETGRIAVEQGLVLLSGGETIGFNEFMATSVIHRGTREMETFPFDDESQGFSDLPWLAQSWKEEEHRWCLRTTESGSRPKPGQRGSPLYEIGVCSRNPEVSTWESSRGVGIRSTRPRLVHTTTGNRHADWTSG